MHEVQAQTTQTKPALAVPCVQFSWTPEVHDFYGDPAAILSKMDNVPMSLDERRIFVLLTESDGHAQVRFFEQIEGGNYAVSTWSGESLDGLNGQMSDTILSNKGVHCVGEQVRGMLSRIGLKLEASVLVPANPRAAFAHTIRAHGESTFTRATTALLC